MARLASNLGFPRMGAQRELKRALERHWRGDATQEELLAGAAELRRRHWALQRDAGIELIPSNDFSLYDHVLDTSVWLGALPERYRTAERGIDLAGYFAAARGGRLDDTPIAALEMTKWFDTNYHYIVPELAVDQHFELTSLIGASAPKPLAEFAEAAAAGVHTRPVLLGPVSFLLLSKLYGADEGRADGLTLLGRVLPVYRELIAALADAGAESVQLDEPMLATDLDDEARDAYAGAYDSLRSAAPSLHLVLTSYFGPLRDNLTLAASLPVDRLHLDLVEGPDQLDEVLGVIPDSMALSLGLVDGRNVWRSDLVEKLTLARRVVDALGADRVLIAPSCSPPPSTGGPRDRGPGRRPPGHRRRGSPMAGVRRPASGRACGDLHRTRAWRRRHRRAAQRLVVGGGRPSGVGQGARPCGCEALGGRRPRAGTALVALCGAP
jgi:5-methyltetrahydropteroyltriglutamate--homocysteine methyltransferase